MTERAGWSTSLRISGDIPPPGSILPGGYKLRFRLIGPSAMEALCFYRRPGLLEKIYPIIKGSAEFCNSTLTSYPEKDWLVTAPSNSPENGFYLLSGEIAHVTIAPTLVIQGITGS